MKIRVVFLVSTLEKGGPTNVIFNIIKYLDVVSFQPVIVTLSPEPLISSLEDFRKLGVEVYQFNQSRLSWVLSGGKRLRKFLEKIQPNIIHSHSLRADIFSAKQLESYIRISTLHANLQHNYINTYGYFMGNYFAYQQVKHVAHLERVVACAHSVYEIYKSKLKSMEFIPNGVDTEIFKVISPESIFQKRKSVGVPTNKKIFITVGSLCNRKDPHTLIKGFLESNAKETSVLLVLGKGELEDELRKTYALPNVMFKGFTRNVVDFLEISDFFISASLSEGLPNTVLEALSCGLPVCLSDIPAHREILSYNSKAGITFKPRESRALTNAINALVGEEYTISQNAAKEIIEHELSAIKMSSKYQSLYCSLYEKYLAK